ncbi:MAG: T9SS type A sorting domain-containing protein [Bacteroidales bacterium]|nr:T9SS type A sorting domain-containing protein [Bacteroidales bacterium]
MQKHNRHYIRLKFLLSAIIIVLFNRLYAQHPGFSMRLDFGGDDVPSMFVLDENGGFVGIVNIAPPTDSFYVHQTSVYRISQFGDTTSFRITKQDTSLMFYRLTKVRSEPSGYILMGLGFKLGDTQYSRFTIFIRLDSELNIIWQKIYRFNDPYLGYRYYGLELTNNDFLYACSNLNKLYLLKLSSQGDSITSKITMNPEAGDLWGLTYNADSTKVLANTEFAYYNGGDSISSAIEIDEETLDFTGHWFYPDYFRGPYRGMPYTENRMLAGGRLQWYHYNEDRVDWMISAYILDSDHNIIHQVHRTNPDTISRAAEIYGIDYVDPSIIYLGGTHNLQDMIGHQPSWIYITRLNDTLGVVYEKYIGGDAYYWTNNITASPDGGVLITATVHDIGITYFQRDAMIIKLDANGSITGTTENKSIPISDAIVYPNPGCDVLQVSCGLPGTVFNLYDMSGKIVLIEKLNSFTTQINTALLVTGGYFWIITKNNNLIEKGKWIKE